MQIELIENGIPGGGGGGDVQSPSTGEYAPGLPDVLTFLKNISNKSNIMPQRIKIELFQHFMRDSEF